MKDATAPEAAKSDSPREQPVAARHPTLLRVRSGVRAGVASAWKLGNKIWQDDWLAPV